MDCPKRSEMRLLDRLAKEFPELLGQEREKVEIDSFEPYTSSLIEAPLKYDPNETASLVVKNAMLGLGEERRLCDVAVAGNVITRVGSPDEIAEVTGPETVMVDAQGRSVAPGFTDSHLHLSVAMERLRACNVEDVDGTEEFRERVSKFAIERREEGALYVFGLHYLDDPVIPAEDCRRFLDDIVGDRPLLVFAHDLHTLWANTEALKTAGLMHAMPPYPHLIEELGLREKIVLDGDGYPTGELREPEVYYFVTGPVQAKFAPSVEQRLDDLKAVCAQLASLGITSVHRMALAQPAEDISFLLLLLELEQNGALPIRVNTSCSSVADSSMLADAVRAYEVRGLLEKARRKEIGAADLHDALVALLEEAGGKRHDAIENLSQAGGTGKRHHHIDKVLQLSRHVRKSTHELHVKPHLGRENPHRREGMPEHLSYHAKVRCDTIKIFMDGVIEKDTAYRLDRDPTKGIPEFKQRDIDRLLEFADKLGMQVAAHSIGDGSVRSMLDAISRAREKNRAADAKRSHLIPHRIEHIETCRERDLHRIGEEHAVASMQPLHERAPVTLWHELVPKSEWNTAFAWKEALDNGAVLVFGSDWPIVSCDVMTGINHAVTRKPWYEGARSQSLNLEEALGAYTTGAAFTEYCGKIRGRLEPGMLADMAILSGDMSDLAGDAPDLRVEKTICDGRIIYERPA